MVVFKCLEVWGHGCVFCFSIVCLSSFVPFGRRVAWLCVCAYFSRLVGSMVGFVLLMWGDHSLASLTRWLLQQMWFCRSSVVFIWSWRLRGGDLYDIVQLFCGLFSVCLYSHSSIQQLVFWTKVSALCLHLVMKTERLRYVWYCLTFLQPVLCLSLLSFLHPTVCPLGGSLRSSSLAWCLGESVSMENGSLKESTHHKKYIYI